MTTGLRECFTEPFLRLSAYRVLGTFFTIWALAPNLTNLNAEEWGDELRGIAHFEVHDATAVDIPGFILALSEDSVGNLFAGGSALRRFDGESWSSLDVVLPTITALHVDTADRLWIGSVDDLGYVDYSSQGSSHYISMLGKTPEDHRRFNQIWDIYELGDEIVFISNKELFIWDGTSISLKTISNVRRRLFSQQIGNELLLFVEGQVWHYSEQELTLLVDSEILGERFVLWADYDTDGDLILYTETAVYKYEGGNLEEIGAGQMAYIAKMRPLGPKKKIGRYFAVPTLDAGILIVDEAGEITYPINEQTGLPLRTMTAFTRDRSGNFWIAGDGLVAMVSQPGSLWSHRLTTGERPSATGEFIFRNEAPAILADGRMLMPEISSHSFVTLCLQWSFCPRELHLQRL